jgi:RNA polymerase sigma-70 factor (ECF subfamily)
MILKRSKKDKQPLGRGGQNIDPKGMDQVYRETRVGLVRYISRYFRKTQEAEDVVQEAFVKVIEAQREREIQSPKAYLYQTARNMAFTQQSTKAFKLTDMVGDVFPESDLLLTKSMEEQYEVRENFEVYCRAVRSLPVKCRRAFVLCRVYGYSQKEVAAHMGVGVKAIEGHLARATRRCMDFMDAEHEQSGLSVEKTPLVRGD